MLNDRLSVPIETATMIGVAFKQSCQSGLLLGVTASAYIKINHKSIRYRFEDKPRVILLKFQKVHIL